MKKNQEKIGEPGYLNKNCWSVKTLNYSPAKRCQYCSLKFHHCLFFQYLIVSSLLVFFLFTLSFLIEGKISQLVAISIFTLVIVYGYFFNKSTEKIIKANFVQRKTNEALRELTETLEERVKQRTKELKEAYEELKKGDKAKSEFVSIASHQLRTPLSAIKWILHMFLDNDLGEITLEQRDLLEKAYKSNERMIALVRDLLNVARIEEGRYLYKPTLTEIENIVEEAISLSMQEVKRKKIKLEFQKPKKRMPRAKIDVEKIKLVVQNLLDNAINYTLPGGRVTISLKYAKKEIEFKIQDTGIGIPKDQQYRIFTKFFRGANVMKIETEGSGLGLFIVKNIIKAHNGKIGFESEENKGSTFWFTLPIG